MKRLRVTVNGKAYEVEVEVLKDDDANAIPYGIHQAPALPEKPAPQVAHHTKSAKPLKRTASDNEKEITSPIAGSVMEIKVKAGDHVEEHDLLMVLEAMKMHVSVSSPVSGSIKSIEVKEKEGVRQGQVLLTFN